MSFPRNSDPSLGNMAIKPLGRKASSKSPKILSHEFVIQNHADIVSCFALIFVVGLMLQVSPGDICYRLPRPP